MMYRIKKRGLIYLLLLLGLTGCTALHSTTLVDVDSEQAVAELPEVTAREAACPTPTEETLLLKHESFGYCLLYPKGYAVQQHYEEAMLLVAGATADVAQAGAVIEVHDAAGHNVAQIADEVLAMVQTTMPGWESERTVGLIIGGAAAIVLDPLPGRELTRQVLIVHDNRTFRLIFYPADPTQADAYAEMEMLYRTVVDSFAFVEGAGEHVGAAENAVGDGEVKRPESTPGYIVYAWRNGDDAGGNDEVWQGVGVFPHLLTPADHTFPVWVR